MLNSARQEIEEEIPAPQVTEESLYVLVKALIDREGGAFGVRDTLKELNTMIIPTEIAKSVNLIETVSNVFED